MNIQKTKCSLTKYKTLRQRILFLILHKLDEHILNTFLRVRFKSIPQLLLRIEIPCMKLLFMYSADKLKQENVLQDVFKQLMVPVNQKYIKKTHKWKEKYYLF